MTFRQRIVLRLIAASILVSPVVRGQEPPRRPPPVSSTPTPAPPATMPRRAHGARWYYVHVPRFANGSRENDPASTPSWSDWRVPDAPSADDDAFDGRAYGGDLQGVIKALPDIRALGCNAVCISPVFMSGDPAGRLPTDLRHVDDRFGVRGAFGRLARENVDPRSWGWSSSDDVLRTLIKEAHSLGMKVVLDIVLTEVSAAHPAVGDVLARGEASPASTWFDASAIQALKGDPAARRAGVPYRHTPAGYFPVMQQFIWDVTARWMDPDRDGNPTDGVDGFRVLGADRAPEVLWRRYRTHFKKINPQALLLAEVRGPAWTWVFGDRFDAVIREDLANRLVECFGPIAGGSLKTLADELETLATRHRTDTHAKTINMLGGPTYGRFMTQIQNARLRAVVPRPVPGGDKVKAPALSAAEIGRHDLEAWRLAASIHHLFAGTPMTYYGEEVGMLGGPGALSRAPFWRPSASQAGTPPHVYRADFAALIKLLHGFHAAHAPFQKGAYKTVIADDARRILAFSLESEAKTVMVVVNASSSKHEVRLVLGRPGDLIGVIRPELAPYKPRSAPPEDPARPVTTPPRLRVAGNRCLVDAQGQISFHLDPMTLKVLLYDKP